jgi:hypothetical protein
MEQPPRDAVVGCGPVHSCRNAPARNACFCRASHAINLQLTNASLAIRTFLVKKFLPPTAAVLPSDCNKARGLAEQAGAHKTLRGRSARAALCRQV